MRYLPIITCIIFVLILGGCITVENPDTSETTDDIECSSECPSLMPPAPEFCEGGTIIPGKIDDCGCQMPPTCKYDQSSKLI